MDQLKEMHPQQNTFEFDNIKVTSKFDSGNLARMEPADSPNHVFLPIHLLVQYVDIYRFSSLL